MLASPGLLTKESKAFWKSHSAYCQLIELWFSFSLFWFGLVVVVRFVHWLFFPLYLTYPGAAETELPNFKILAN